MEGSKCQGPERTFDPPHAETPAALPLGDAEQRRLSSHTPWEERRLHLLPARLKSTPIIFDREGSLLV